MLTFLTLANLLMSIELLQKRIKTEMRIIIKGQNKKQILKDRNIILAINQSDSF